MLMKQVVRISTDEMVKNLENLILASYHPLWASRLGINSNFFQDFLSKTKTEQLQQYLRTTTELREFISLRKSDHKSWKDRIEDLESEHGDFDYHVENWVLSQLSCIEFLNYLAEQDALDREPPLTHIAQNLEDSDLPF